MVLKLGVSNLQAQQATWKEGIIIFSDGYIAYGLIGEESNATQCQFKSPLNNQVYLYKTTDLRAYAYTDGIAYQKILLDSSQALFAEQLVKGKISLYQNEGVFFAKNAARSNVVELSSSSGNFREKLAGLMTDCYFNNIKKRVNKTKLTKASLIRTIELYNGICTNLTPADSTRLANRVSFISSSRFGLAGGVTLANISFTNRPYLSEATYNTPVVYSLGAFYEYLIPRSPISFKFGVMYNTSQFYDMASEVGLENGGTLQNEVTLELQYLAIPVTMKYTLNAQRLFSPFLEVGGVAYNLQNYTGTRRQESLVNGVVKTDEPSVVNSNESVNSISVGWLVGLGTHIKIYQRTEGILKFQVSKGRGFLPNSSFFNIQVLGGVRF